MLLRLTPLEWLLERLHLLPAPLLDTPLAPGIGRALVTACELDLFETLQKRAMSLTELADHLKCLPQRLYPLLQLLVVAGYLRLRGGLYANRSVTRRWLIRSSPKYIAPYIIHSPDIIAMWEQLTESMRTNQALVRMPYEEDPASPEVQRALERHYAGLASLALVLGRELLYRIHLPHTATRLLDVGGSHGAYSSLFCQKHSQLRATILDLPAGIEAGKHLTPHMGAGERIDFYCLDLLKDEWPQDFTASFDVALYLHMAHLLPPEVNEQLITRVVRCLKPGAILIYVDQVTDQTHTPRIATAMVQLMALTMNLIGGTCYPFLTVKGWMERAGMEQVRSHHLWTPGVTLITARKA